MFSYYGSKSKLVNYYPYPQYDKIIEPFAGSARYSLKHFEKDILLIDKYEVIIKIWHYLQAASEQDILGLPNLERGDDIRNFNLSDEERLFIGFCINRGSVTPKNIVADFQTWNKDKKWFSKILYKIKHWEIRQGDYNDIPNLAATWFIDPPYQFGGEHYKENSFNIDFNKLADWCKSREGQIIVCENSKASWLPFKQMAKLSGQKHITTEAIWSNLPTAFDNEQIQMFAAT